MVDLFKFDLFSRGDDQFPGNVEQFSARRIKQLPRCHMIGDAVPGSDRFCAFDRFIHIHIEPAVADKESLMDISFRQFGHLVGR